MSVVPPFLFKAVNSTVFTGKKIVCNTCEKKDVQRHPGQCVFRWGGVLSTVGVFSTVGDIMSTVGNILSTLGNVQYRGGYHDTFGVTVGGYHFFI